MTMPRTFFYGDGESERGAGMVAGWRRHGGYQRRCLFFLDGLCAARTQPASGEHLREPVGETRDAAGIQLCWTFRARPRIARPKACEAGYLGAQIALASDAAGTVYALWNAGVATAGLSESIFLLPPPVGQAGPRRRTFLRADGQVEHCFPAITAGAAGDVRIAWMDTRNNSRCGTSSIAVRVMVERPGRRKRSFPDRCVDTITSCPTALNFPSATISQSRLITSETRTWCGARAEL